MRTGGAGQHGADQGGADQGGAAARGAAARGADVSEAGEPVEVVMTTDVQPVDRNATVTDVAVLMRDHDLRSVVVVDDVGGLHGIVSDRDLVTRVLAVGRDPDTETVGDICSETAATVAVDDDAAAAVHVMSRHEVPRVPVMKEGSVVGVVTLDAAAEHMGVQSLLESIDTPDLVRRPSERD